MERFILLVGQHPVLETGTMYKLNEQHPVNPNGDSWNVYVFGNTHQWIAMQQGELITRETHPERYL